MTAADTMGRDGPFFFEFVFRTIWFYDKWERYCNDLNYSRPAFAGIPGRLAPRQPPDSGRTFGLTCIPSTPTLEVAREGRNMFIISA